MTSERRRTDDGVPSSCALRAFFPGEVVDGTVIAINKREVVVNIGYKSDGIIPASNSVTTQT